MPFDVYNSSGARIAQNISQGQLDGYYKDGFIKQDDKVVDTTYLEKNRKEKMPYYHTAIAKDIARVKKRRG